MSLRNCMELPIFLIFISLYLSNPITENFVIYRTCYVVMGRNQSACANLGVDTSDDSTRALEIEVQEVANYIGITLNLFSVLLSCLMLLFIGPYSDKKGRKNILIISSAGLAISGLLKVFVAMFPNLSPWYLAIQIPIMPTGGIPTFVSVTYCYLVDVTEPSNRNMRMGYLESAVRSGMILGSLCSSYIFHWIGYIGSFVLCFVLTLIACGFIVLFISETIQIDENADVQFFTVVSIQDMGATAFKRREGYNRVVLLGCMGSILLEVLCDWAYQPEMLLLRAKFFWELQHLTNYSSARWTATIITMCILIYILQKFFKGAESVLILLAASTSAIGIALFAVANCDWQIYAATVLRLPVGVIVPIIRSMISKIISPNETGKIFPLSFAIEAFTGQCSVFLYVIIYTGTIHVFPGLFEFIPVVNYIVITMFFGYVYVLANRGKSIIYVKNNDATGNSNINAKLEHSHKDFPRVNNSQLNPLIKENFDNMSVI